ncbi:MAG: tetratricopeptide repeat protein [Treponema sp.]|nr:tetratricopeptide repeat protein [Treponema sp.]MCL2237029.1 tetratricopeptide repeat protein [Treponema sp.]
MVIKVQKGAFLHIFFTLILVFSGNNAIIAQSSGGLAEEIRTLTETGVLSSMLRALELIRSNNLSGAEFGRTMTGANVLLIRLVYPDTPAALPVIDLPQTSNYTRIIREAEAGNYSRPPENSSDFLAYILPFLAINERTPAATLQNVLRDLENAAILRPASIFPHYFTGLIHERSRRLPEAEAAYRRAIAISDQCYPAQIGIARLRRLAGNNAEALALFNDLAIRYPDSSEIRRQIATTYFESRDWQRALNAVDEILRSEPRNGDFILMRAAILIEQGQFAQANTTLDTYVAINPNNRSYLFMRARVQAEGNRNRDSALNYLRSILRAAPDDTEVMVYTSNILMESSRTQDQTEGRELLERLQRTSGASVDVLALGLRDAVRRESWQEAQGILNRVLAARRTPQDLTDAYHVERGLGNNSRAFNFARELYDRDNSNNDYIIIYISALIDTGRRDEASRMIEARLGAVAGGALKSRYFFLRSRLHTNQENALSDLRSSLFEDPRNLEALIAMFLIYHNRREERRAVHYLRQALAIAPDHPRLRRYEREYSTLLGR